MSAPRSNIASRPFGFERTAERQIGWCSRRDADRGIGTHAVAPQSHHILRNNTAVNGQVRNARNTSVQVSQSSWRHLGSRRRAPAKCTGPGFVPIDFGKVNVIARRESQPQIRL